MALAVAALASTALGGGQSRFSTIFKEFELTVTRDADTVFKGVLSSREESCAQRRKVKLFQERDGQTKKVGADESSGKGKFSVTLGGTPKEGRYYGKLSEKTLGSGGGEIVCLKAVSGKIKVTVNG